MLTLCKDILKRQNHYFQFLFLCTLVFQPTIAKTFAIMDPFTDGAAEDKGHG